MSQRTRTAFGQAAVAAAIAALAGGLAFLAPTHGEATMDRQMRRTIPLRSVFILAFTTNARGEIVSGSRGSGTIITEDGAVITNRHVLWDARAGRPYERFAVGLINNFDANPELQCLGFPQNGVLNEDLDLALIKCERDMQDRPFTPRGWPTIQVGASEDMVLGDPIWVIGFPGTGGTTVTMTDGKVAGWRGRDGGGGRFWIKTNADIAQGNSGGTAVDDDGLYIGVPTAVQLGQSDQTERQGLLRPVELFRDLIALAQHGWQPGPNGGTTGTAGGPPGQDPGQTAPPPARHDRPVTIVGIVKADDDGDPIAGAYVVIFKPGVRSADVTRDNIGEKALTWGVTNSQGQFVVQQPVPRDQRYTVWVAADGFQLLQENDVLSTAGNVPERYQPWDVITLTRQ